MLRTGNDRPYNIEHVYQDGESITEGMFNSIVYDSGITRYLTTRNVYLSAGGFGAVYKVDNLDMNTMDAPENGHR